MAEKPGSRNEFLALLKRVLALPDVNKFEVFQKLQEDLSATVLDNPKTRVIEQRKESLEAIAQVSQHLALEDGQTLTSKQFDSAAKELGLSLSSAAITRAWGSWRSAIEASQGQRTAGAKLRLPSLHRIKKKMHPSEYLTDVEKWLEQDPKILAREAYDEFAREHNLQAAKGSGLSGAQAVQGNLGVRWKWIVAVAQGKMTLEKAVELEIAETLPVKTENALVGMATIARLLNMSYARASKRSEFQKSFPTPVAHIKGARAWLYEDIKLYKRGLSSPSRVEDELQALYMDAPEVSAACEVSQLELRSHLRYKHWSEIPQPEGAIARGYYYWKRASVKQWLKHMRGQ